MPLEEPPPLDIARLAVAGTYLLLSASSSFSWVCSGAMPRIEACSSLRSPRIGAWLAAAKSMSATGSVLPSKVEPLGVGLTLVDVYCLMTYASLKSEPVDSTDFFRVWGS